MTPLLTTLFLLSANPIAQTVGGEYDILHQWNGGTSFGSSVSGAGDVNADGFIDFIVGAPEKHNKSGSAYVLSGTDGSLLHQWDGNSGLNFFGHSVSGAGDANGDGYDDLLVGAYGESGTSGSAYLYSGADGSLLHQWTGQPWSSDYFGRSVSDAGDVNADGFGDVIVGATYASPGGLTYAGSAFVFSGLDGSQLFQWNGEAASYNFGDSVSAAGDVNGDGFGDLIVGAPAADPGGSANAGSAFVFSGANGSLLYRWNGDADHFHFGNSVSDAGDVNGDGFADLVVGAPWANNGGLNSAGSAYVFSGADGSLLHQWDSDSAETWFGDSVSSAGDVNGDGFDDLIVGAPWADHGGFSRAGSAFFYSGLDGSLLHQGTGGSRYEYYGTSVSGAGDVDGNGLADVIIGASGRGSAFAYSFNPFLQANATTISASTGGVLNLNLNFPDAAGFDEYKILISKSGIGPSWHGVNIPLTRDSLVLDTYFGIYPVSVNNMHGTLDANGDASGSLTVPAGISSTLIGNTFFFAAIANQLSQLPEYSSVAVLITITP
jgi:hypothetical protein